MAIAFHRLKNQRMQAFVFFLVFSFFFLQPVGKSFEAAYAILALLGLVALVKNPRQVFEDQQTRYYGCIFILFYVPVVASCVGAFNLAESSRIALVFIRIFFAGVFVIINFRTADSFRKLDMFLAVVLLLWLFDGAFQAIVGQDVFGTIPPKDRLSSVFIKHPLKFGLMMATFSPFLLVSAARRGMLWFFLSLLLSGGVIFLAGSRGGWIAFAVVVAGLFSYHLFVSKKIAWWFVALLLVCFLGAGTLAYFSHAPLQAKVDQTLLVFKGDEKSINQAITYRVPIWRTAWRMFSENPINGVGARGFRYAYEKYSLNKDLIVEPRSTVTGAYHAHQILMDVAAETGGLGIAGLLGSWLMLGVIWIRAPRKNKEHMLPYGLCLLAIFFPVNTNFATYSSSWSATIFLLIALFCAASKTKVCEQYDLK